MQTQGKHVDLDSLKQAVVDGLGPDYALASIITLDQLSMVDFPINATGKIMKIHLKESAIRYLQRTQGSP